MFTLATLPQPATLMTDIGAWSSPFFNDLLPFATFSIGVLLGGMLISFLITVVTNVVNSLIHKR